MSPEVAMLGEDNGLDLREAAADHAQKTIDGEASVNTYMELGEHGEVYLDDIDKVEAAEKDGHLKVYLKQAAELATDPKVVVPLVVALGALTGGLAHRKYRKK